MYIILGDKMITVGIFSGYYPFDIDTTIQYLKEQGFTTVQLDVGFKDYPELMNKMEIADNLNKEKAIHIRNKFRDANIQISAIYGYINLLEENFEKRDKNIRYIKSILKHARDLGSPYVVTETGTYSKESDYSYDERNHTEQTYQELKSIIKDLIEYAKKYGAILLIEPYINNVIHDISSTKRIFEELGNDHFGLLMDPANYYNKKNLDEMDDVLIEMFRELDKYIHIAHAKDVCLSNGDYNREAARDEGGSHTYRGSKEIDLPAIGLGVLNYRLYLQLLSMNHPNIALIIEHLPMSDIPRAKKYLDKKLKEVGV